MKQYLKIIQHLFVFIIIQLIIVAVFLFANSVNNVTDVAIYEEIITVEQTEYRQVFISGSQFCFFANGIEYGFPKYPIVGTDEYSMHELNSCINSGDMLSIEYIDRSGHRTVINAKKDNAVLRSKANYFDYLERQRIAGIVVFIIIELIFIAALTLYCIFNKKMIVQFFKKRKKKHNNL